VAPELSEYRLYRQGDDPRQLDWKLLARSDRAYIRLAEDRSLLATWFVVDASASMAFPAGSHDKWKLACDVALGLASVALSAGDPVGLVVAHDRTPARTPARSRRGTLSELLATLGVVQPAGSAKLAPHVSDIRAGARVVIVSDFLGDEGPTLVAARALMAANSDVHAVHVVAREEIDPQADAIRAVDPEDELIARPFDESMRARYLANYVSWQADTAAAWRHAGATWTTVTTGEDPGIGIRRVITASSGEIVLVAPT
jgi:uncharacterized protein (DUF58 family)